MITVALSGHRRRLRWLVHGAALLAWAVIGALLLIRWVDAPKHPPTDAVVLWSLAGAALLWNAGRKGAGRETLTVMPSHLVVRRAVGFFQLKRRFDLTGVGRVGIARVATEGPDQYKVQFEYGGRLRRFGRNLSLHEADCIASLILQASAAHHAGV